MTVEEINFQIGDKVVFKGTTQIALITDMVLAEEDDNGVNRFAILLKGYSNFFSTNDIEPYTPLTLDECVALRSRILDVCNDLASSQGFYGRLREDIMQCSAEDMQDYLYQFKNCKTDLDFIMQIEGG